MRPLSAGTLAGKEKDAPLTSAAAATCSASSASAAAIDVVSSAAVSGEPPPSAAELAAAWRADDDAAARDGGRSALAMDLAARAYSLVHRGGHMVTDGRLGVRVVLHAGHYSRPPACARRTECLCHGHGRLGRCADA